MDEPSHRKPAAQPGHWPRGPSRSGSPFSAEALLSGRFARGEIDITDTAIGSMHSVWPRRTPEIPSADPRTDRRTGGLMPDRVLILANEFITDAEHALPEHLRRQADQTREVLVIAPVLTTWLQWLASDTDAAHAAAQHRAGQIAADISRRRHPPHTDVGDENQLLAVADALAHFAADAVIVVNHDHTSENYHERGVAQQIVERFQLPTTVLTVNSHGRLTHHETL